MKIIKDYFDKKEKENKQKEIDYRLRVKEEAQQAKREINVLKELQKDEKTLDELRTLRAKLKPKPKWSKAIEKFMNSSDSALKHFNDVNKKYKLGDTKDMFKTNLDRIVFGEPKKISKKSERLFDI